MATRRPYSGFLSILLNSLGCCLFLFVCGCGGGSTASSTTNSGGNPPVTAPPPPPPSVSSDFSLVVTPDSLTVPSGSEGSFQVGIQPSGGFASAVQIQIGNLPQNTTLSPSANFSLTSTSPQAVQIATADNLPGGSYSLTVTGTSGQLTHSVVLNFTTQLSTPLPSRADFVRTDDTPVGAVYDQTHKVVYVANPVLGKVDLVSSETYQVLHSIRIPSPAGIDITADGSTVYVGTDTQALYAIDTASQTISQRYFVPVQTFPGNALTALHVPLQPLALSNGLLLFILNNQILTWNPQTDTFTPVLGASANYMPSIFSKSANGKKVIISDYLEPSTVYVYDVDSNSLNGPISFQGFAANVAAKPDGTQFSVSVYGGYSQLIFVLDSNLKTLAQIQAGGSLLYSADGKTLYIAGSLGNVPVIDLLDTTTLQFVGTAPSYSSGIPYFRMVPPFTQETPLTTDETGRIFGSADHGLAIDDATDLRAYTGNEIFSPPILVDPDAGPVGHAQQVLLENQQYSSVPNVWFGPLAARSTSISGVNLSTTAPASAQPGPVNVRLNGSDKVQEFIPQSYNYAAQLLPGPDLAAPASGQTVINLYGYGLDASLGEPPQVSIGTSAANIQRDDFFSTETIYPFPLDHLSVEPPVIAPGVYDITASSSAGSSTLKAVYHALNIASYPVDSEPYTMCYDKRRNQVYLSTMDHVDVFSLSSNQFVAPFQVPTIHSQKQLGGLALTPDGNHLIVSNWADGSVAVINPDNPLSATAIAVTLTAPQVGAPNEVAATNAGTALIDVAGPPQASIPTPNTRTNKLSRKPRAQSDTLSSPYPPTLWQLDLSTLSVKPYDSFLFSPNAPMQNLYMSSSDDGAYVCITGGVQMLTLYNASTGASVSAPTLGAIHNPYECAIGGSIIGAGTSQNFNSLVSKLFYQVEPQTFDFNLNIGALASEPDYRSYNERGTAGANVLIGMAVDPTGAIFYEPNSSGVTLFDTHTGEIRESISIGSTVYNLYDGSLIRDETGNELFLVTSSGFTIIQIDALPIAIGSISASGNSWTITGTGFTSGTTLVVDGSALPTQFTDSQHLQISAAPNLNQAQTLTLSNVDGHTYTYAAAYFR